MLGDGAVCMNLIGTFCCVYNALDWFAPDVTLLYCITGRDRITIT